MWIARIVALATVATAMSSGLVLAQANCDWYALNALEQQRRNIERGCGFDGPSWSSDRSRHLAWCKSSSPDEWKRQSQLREQQLAKCIAR